VKELKILKSEDDFGFFHTTKKELAVNIGALWRISQSEAEFVEMYSRIVHHEWLHEEIFEATWEWQSTKEESIVEDLSGTYYISALADDDAPKKDLYQVWKVED